MSTFPGKVYLVGAGPGDPGLITVKAMRLIEKADVIVFDHLVNQRILSYARPQARKIDAGKQAGRQVLEQGEINRLLVKEAKAGRMVVRLKGGDPFIFGRGGEECEVLAMSGIPFEVVPGVTSAIAAPAYAGIPLTHRACASSVAFVTGHEDPAKKTGAVDFTKLAQAVDTVVCLMGVGTMDRVVGELKMGGAPPDMPVAVIERGTYPSQRVVEGTLATIISRVKLQGIRPPAVMVVGKVTQLRKKISWFESLPLYNKTVMITRAEEQADALADLLEGAGARVICFPTIAIGPPRSYGKLDGALRRLRDYQYLVFTSVNGVNAFVSRMEFLHMDRNLLRNGTIAALGEMTAGALRGHGLIPGIVPAVFTSRHLVAAFKGEHIRGKKALLVRSDIAGDLLPRALKKMGAAVEEVSSYCIKKPRVKGGEVRRLIEKGLIDCITFTSPSTFVNFTSLMKGTPGKRLLKKTAVAAIGPVTAQEIAKHGIKVSITASPHTVPGLVRAIAAYYSAMK
jgi:uroporphyrinogen III methyltransferase/synthase